MIDSKLWISFMETIFGSVYFFLNHPLFLVNFKYLYILCRLLFLIIVLVYFEQGRSTTSSTVSFTIATGGTWKILVSQIECYSMSRAYPGCNQFFTGVSGTFHSYNWPTVQLQSKRHNICLRKELGEYRFKYVIT